VTSFYAFLSLKNDVNTPSKSNKQKKLEFLFLVGSLKVTDEKSRIRGSGSVPKCHGSGTLKKKIKG
jgi:hypothetical protein